MIHMVTYSRSPARLAARRQRGSRTSDNRQSVSLEVGKNEKFLRAEQLMINTWERALVSAPLSDYGYGWRPCAKTKPSMWLYQLINWLTTVCSESHKDEAYRHLSCNASRYIIPRTHWHGVVAVRFEALRSRPEKWGRGYQKGLREMKGDDEKHGNGVNDRDCAFTALRREREREEGWEYHIRPVDEVKSSVNRKMAL
ncbi:hypothetical protein V8E52_000164 [Russula decolorans]